jgi:hypothetical protein
LTILERTGRDRRLTQWIPALPVAPPDTARLMDVVFNVTRGRPLPPSSPLDSEGLPAFLRWDPQLAAQVPLNVLRYRLAPKAYAPQPIAVDSSGEHVELVKIVLRRENPEPVAVFAPVPECPKRGLQPRDINDAVGASIGAREYLTSLRRFIDGLPDGEPRKAALELFYAFDLHTNPLIWENLLQQQEDLGSWLDSSLVPDPGNLEAAIASTLSRLEGRLKQRVALHPAVPHFDPYDPENEEEAWRDTRELSTLQLNLLKGRTLAELGAAFEMFANGSLRVQLDNLAIAAQPSSGFYFFFGEFALLAMDNKVNTRSWKNRARFMLRTQRVFAETYADPNVSGPARTLDSYTSLNFCGSKVIDTEDYEHLSAYELAQRAGENAKSYLGGL